MKRKAQKKIVDEIFPGFSERSERGRKSREKGAKFERLVANIFKSDFPRARRMFGQARDGDEVPDVGGTPFWIECTDSGASIGSKLAQGLAASDTSPNEEYRGLSVAVVSHHKRGDRIMITMEVKDFLALLRSYD